MRPQTSWVGRGLEPSHRLLLVIAIYTVYSTATTQASYLLAAVEKVKAIAIIGVIMAAVNVAASIAFTHLYGITGPILGSIFPLVFIMTIPLIVLCRRQLRLMASTPGQRPRKPPRPPRRASRYR